MIMLQVIFIFYLVSLVIICIVIFVGFVSWHMVEKRFLKKAKSVRIDWK